MAHDYTPERHISERHISERHTSEVYGSELYDSELYDSERYSLEGKARRVPSAVDELAPAKHWDDAVGFAAELDEAEAGIEWGSEGVLARELLAAALGDVAPSQVRERVLASVDAVLIEPALVAAFPSDAAPVTTLSGVFEKRPPSTTAASCIERATDATALETGEVASVSVPPAGTSAANGAAVMPSSPVRSSPVPSSPAFDEGQRGMLRVAVRSVFTTRAGSAHCCGGPMLGGRCRSGSVAPVAPGLGLAEFGAVHSSLSSRLDASSFVPVAGCSFPLEVAFAPPERLSSRLRDGLATSAFNLVQLAAAIVVGIGIGKAAHLVMAEDVAMAWSPAAAVPDGLRAEPGRSPDTELAAEPFDSLDRPAALRPLDIRQTRAPSRRRAAHPGRGMARGSMAARSAASAPANPVDACNPGAGRAGATPSGAAPFACQTAISPIANSPRPGASYGAAPAGDDWLGEQLAILARAERSLLEGDPENAARSLDEYKSRFPDGLLDPQMASIRQRVEQRFTAFIFP